MLVCPNGMGHFYRLFHIARFLSRKYHIYFFCSRKQYKMINVKLKNIKPVCLFKDVEIDEKNLDFLLNFYNKDLNKLQKIRESKIIISDNLINKIYLKKKFILISNFFWGKSFKTKSKKFKIYKKFEKKFVRTQNILQNKYFALPYDKYLNKSYINFTGIHRRRRNKLKKNRIFIYNRKNIQIFPIIENLKSKYEFFSNVPNEKYNIKFFDINNGLDEFKFILARPGLGSISDCIRYNVPILSFIENNKNLEMLQNNKLIKKYDIGFLLNNKKNLNKVLNISPGVYNRLSANLKNFKFCGERDVLNYVKKI